MKKLVLLGLVAGAAYKVAQHYNIKSLDDLKNLLMPEEEPKSARTSASGYGPTY